MSLTYLKVDPEEAIKILEEWIIKGYRILTCITNDYQGMQHGKSWGDNSSTLEVIQKWQNWSNEWYQGCQSDLLSVFVSLREVYNFDSARPLFGATSKDTRYVGIKGYLQARIDQLNKYTDFIFNQYNIKFTVEAGRDAFIIHGDKSYVGVKNGN